MEIKIVQWSGNSANEGLNLGAGMQQQFEETADGALQNARAFTAHVDVGEKQFRKVG